MGRTPVMAGGRAEYDRLYKWSITNPADFWGKVRSRLPCRGCRTASLVHAAVPLCVCWPACCGGLLGWPQ